MSNFLAILISSIKGKKSGILYFMGDYGVIIVHLVAGEVVWVESTWSAGCNALRRVVEWGGGKFRMSPLETGTQTKRNVNLNPKQVIASLLAWETERLGFKGLEHQPVRSLPPDLLIHVNRLVVGQLVQNYEKGTVRFPEQLEMLKSVRFTGFLLTEREGGYGAVFLVHGKCIGAYFVQGDEVFLGESALQSDVGGRLVKSDLFTVSNLVVPLWGSDEKLLETKDLVEHLNSAQKELDALFLIRLWVKEASALGLVYRSVYAGTLVKKSPDAPPSMMPQAVIVKLSMLPGVHLSSFRYDLPVRAKT